MGNPLFSNTSRKVMDLSSSIKALLINFLKLTMFGAEASATEATAVSSSETFGSANRATVGVTQTWPLETVALRLTSSCFCHHCWPHHLCSSHKPTQVINNLTLPSWCTTNLIFFNKSSERDKSKIMKKLGIAQIFNIN